MGRKPTTNLNLPRHMRARKRGKTTYYFFDTGGKPRKEIPLGTDYALAVKRWSELYIDVHGQQPKVVTFRYVAERYRLEVIPTKAAETQHGNLKELRYLLEFFDNPPAELDQIQPIHIRQYLDWRKESHVRANREKALFSHIWNKAREWGYTALANPCLGIKGYKESGRDVYVEDNEYQAVWNCADQPLRDAMDLAYLTGQRPADTLRFQETDIREGALFVLQNKTKERLRVAITGKLAEVIEGIMERKREHKIRSLSLVCNEQGKALSKYALRSRFDKARAKSGVQFQFRDLRAKAGTDKADATDMREAQKQLGHKTISMTEHYVRKRRGEKVDPTK